MYSTTISRATERSGLIHRLVDLVRKGFAAFGYLAPVVDLAVRLWVATAFFKSGLTKIESFTTTLQLFRYEYSVPLLPPEVAAYAGTFTEIFFPVLLAFGLAGRLPALVLFVFNVIAVVSYPELGEAGLRDHYVWGLLLLVTLSHGPGRLSLDHFVGRLISRTRA